MTKKSCEFCMQEFKAEDLISTPIDEGEIAEICEDCKTKLEENVEY